jgi:hypothetical protein
MNIRVQTAIDSFAARKSDAAVCEQMQFCCDVLVPWMLKKVRRWQGRSKSCKQSKHVHPEMSGMVHTPANCLDKEPKLSQTKPEPEFGHTMQA